MDIEGQGQENIGSRPKMPTLFSNFQGHNTTEDTNRQVVQNTRYHMPEIDHDTTIRLSMSDIESNLKFDSQIEVTEEIIDYQIEEADEHKEDSPVDSFNYISRKHREVDNYGSRRRRVERSTSSSPDYDLDTSEVQNDTCNRKLVTRSICKNKLGYSTYK